MKTVFFSPYSFIWEHSSTEVTFMKALIKAGVDTYFIKCGRDFSDFCTSMECISLSVNSPVEDKEAVCAACVKNSGIISMVPGLKSLGISEFFTADDQTLINELLKGVHKDSIELEFEGIPFHRIANYEIILRYKLKKMDFSDEQFAMYLTTLKNCLKAYLASKCLMVKLKPDNLIIYSPQYAINNAFSKGATLNGVPTYFIEGTENLAHRYQNTRIWSWDTWQLVNPSKFFWNLYGSINLPPIAYKWVTDHFRELLKGTNFSVYSEPQKHSFELSQIFGFPKEAKVGLMAMSSHDEAFAAYYIGAFPEQKVKSKVFIDQVDWVRHTIAFYTKHPDQYLVIRIHPRDFPNKRDTVMSPQYKELAEFFKTELPANVRVNWPEEKISIYDLFETVDYLLTGWSATALEGSLYDLPIILYDEHLPSYPLDSFYTGGSKEDYYQNLDRAIRGDLKADPEMAIQWWAINHYINALKSVRNNNRNYQFRMLGYKVVRVLKMFRFKTWDADKINKVADILSFEMDPESQSRLLDVLQNSRKSLLDPEIPFNRNLLNKAGATANVEKYNELSTIKGYFRKS